MKRYFKRTTVNGIVLLLELKEIKTNKDCFGNDVRSGLFKLLFYNGKKLGDNTDISYSLEGIKEISEDEIMLEML